MTAAPSTLVDQDDAAHDERDAADLLDAERLAEKEVAEHRHDCIGERHAGKGDRDRDLAQRDEVEEGGRGVERQAAERRGPQDLGDEGRRIGAGA